MGFFDVVGLGFIYRFLKDLVGAGLRWWKGTVPIDKIALRQKWKPQFEQRIREQFSKKLRSDAIIRDVKRVDQYPELNEKSRGISPWFRVGLVGTYHRGIYVAFQWTLLVQVGESEFRLLDYDKDDQATKDVAIKVIQLGSVPFENIQEVDFEGDEYYGYPHVYCHFSIRGQPYEKVAYYTEQQLFSNSLPFYTEVAEAKSVEAASRKHRVKGFLF